MEETKFLEAQNLKNQIQYLVKCLDSLKNEKNAAIGITWQEVRAEYNYTGSNTYPLNT